MAVHLCHKTLPGQPLLTLQLEHLRAKTTIVITHSLQHHPHCITVTSCLLASVMLVNTFSMCSISPSSRRCVAITSSRVLLTFWNSHRWVVRERAIVAWTSGECTLNSSSHLS